MNVTFDHWASEKHLFSQSYGRSRTTLRSSGWVDEREGATWLRTSEFGDEKDRVLIKSDGEPTYFVPDIAYHNQKFDPVNSLSTFLGQTITVMSREWQPLWKCWVTQLTAMKPSLVKT